MQNFLEIGNVSKSFGQTEVLRGLDLSVKEKEILVLLGPSGCGKTTLLRIIAGLIEPDGGSLTLEGKDLLSVPVEKREIGFVFQKYALFPHMNVEDNITFGLKLRKLDKNEIRERLDSVLDLVELKGYEKRMINELSGGQQQRVALARAIIIKPKLMLLDEPLSNLDAKLRASVRVNIVRILKKLGITAIMVTHDQIEAMTMGDRVVLMNEGKISQDGKPKEIYFNPRNLFVAEFLGTPRINVLPLKKEGTSFFLGSESVDGSLLSLWTKSDTEALPDGTYSLGVRPENIVRDSSGYKATVNLLEVSGADTNVHLTFLGSDYVMRTNSEGQELMPGDEIEVSFLPSSCFLFDKSGERI